IQVRRMFGGYGLFRSGLMFAVVLKDELYFKADEVNVERFQARGLPPFSYEAKGKPTSLRYYLAPNEVLDEPSAMSEWAQEAFACALRQKKNRQPTRPRTPRRTQP